MLIRNSADILTAEEKTSIHSAALDLLEEPGFRVENSDLLDLLAGFGATIHRAEERVHFPRRLIERFVADAASEAPYEDGMECSCLFPDPTRPDRCGGIEATAGTYPHLWMDADGHVGLHNLRSIETATRLADALPGYDRLGVMGVPNDVPPILGPLYMRLLAWKHATGKLSNCGEVRDARLIPYIVEMGKIMADHKGASCRRFTFAEVELIPPWQFKREEAHIFVEFWKRGLLAGVGSMISAGGSGPVTLAGVMAMMIAESLFISILYRLCYGWKRLFIQCNSSILDMKAGAFAFGRPERSLLILASGSMARYYQALLWASAVAVDAKQPGPEAGYQCMFNVMPAVMAGTLGLECFGILSGGEANSAVQLVLDSEMLCAVKRLVRGFETTAETLALDVIRDVGVGGLFTDHEHTVRHFRGEFWDPALFSRTGYNAWNAAGCHSDVDLAKEKTARLLAEHHPRGVDEETESALMEVIWAAKRHLAD